MSEAKKRILHTIQETNAKLLFNRIEPDCINIDEVYINNLNSWYSYNSDNIESKDGTGIERTNGIFKNSENFNFSRTKKGFELSEIDFIDAEFKQLEVINLNNLMLTEKKQFTFYTDYLNEKRKCVEWTLNDYYNHYLQTKRFGICFYRTYKKNEYSRFLTELNSHKERFTYILNKLSQHDKNEFINDFLDQLDKLKSHQQLSKFIEYINDFTKRIRTELNAIRIEKAYSIENYKKSYNPFYFKEIINLKSEDNSINPYYYNTLINHWEDYQVTEMSKNEYLKEQTRLLKIYNRRLSYLLSHTVRMFKAVDKYNGENLAVVNSFNLEKGELLNLLNRIKWYSSSIKRMKISGEYDLAFRLKEYYHLIFADSINFLRDSLHINIYKSPLKEEFKEIENAFESSINIDEVKYFASTALKPQLQTKSDQAKYKNEVWFKVGLLFASGKMENYYTEVTGGIIFKKGYTAPKVAKSLGNINYNKFILASVNNYLPNNPNGNKNIFNSKDKMDKIIKHCGENNIPVIPYFTERLPSE